MTEWFQKNLGIEFGNNSYVEINGRAKSATNPPGVQVLEGTGLKYKEENMNMIR